MRCLNWSENHFEFYRETCETTIRQKITKLHEICVICLLISFWSGLIIQNKSSNLSTFCICLARGAQSAKTKPQISTQFSYSSSACVSGVDEALLAWEEKQSSSSGNLTPSRTPQCTGHAPEPQKFWKISCKDFCLKSDFLHIASRQCFITPRSPNLRAPILLQSAWDAGFWTQLTNDLQNCTNWISGHLDIPLPIKMVSQMCISFVNFRHMILIYLPKKYKSKQKLSKWLSQCSAICQAQYFPLVLDALCSLFKIVKHFFSEALWEVWANSGEK